MPPSARRGVYGLALPDLDLPHWTVDATGWPEARIDRQVVAEPPPRPGLHRHRGSFSLAGGGRVALDRDPLRICFRSPVGLTDDEIVHPCLSVAAAGVSYWLGRDPFHAGAFAGADGAWMVTGRSGAGKSTLIAALALAGAPVLSDDLVVMGDGGRVYAGPRAVDLLPESAGALGIEHRVVRARGATRERLPLPGIPSELAPAGWIDLEWGSDLSLRRMDAAERLRRLARRRTFPAKLPVGSALLDLVERPGWVLRRPRRLADVPAAVAAVLDLTGCG